MTSFVVNISETLQRSAAEDPVPDLHPAAGRDMEEIVVKEEEMIQGKKERIERRTVLIIGWILSEGAADRAGLYCTGHAVPLLEFIHPLLASPAFVQTSSIVLSEFD
jgi:hypothetical protein